MPHQRYLYREQFWLAVERMIEKWNLSLSEICQNMKEFHIHEIANEIDTSDYKIEVQLEVQANADALS